ALALMTPVEYILKENKNCNMWWTHTGTCLMCLYDSVCSCIAIHREATVKNHETGNKKTDDTRRYSSL
ncbi:hypothetical protein OSK94_08475, partial [Escherichia coli]|nr:hypothetical protein [Escherichia coli]MDA6558559.1 hypothetical protein [Escherichia coli]